MLDEGAAVRSLSGSLSAKPSELPARVSALQEELRAAQKEVAALKSQVAAAAARKGIESVSDESESKFHCSFSSLPLFSAPRRSRALTRTKNRFADAPLIKFSRPPFFML